MLGNVSEWWADTWHEGYKDAPTDGSAWKGRDSARVLRGGGWDDFATFCRSAVRFRRSPDYQGTVVGLRVVVELE